MRSTVDDALKQLADAGKLFVKVMEHGSMSAEIYRPLKTDLQTPHLQDELYIVISGAGRFFNDGTITPFGPGDVLFAAAGKEHRFIDFTDDFTTWVVFYGPEGGEADI